jgi:hypothetical protein
LGRIVKEVLARVDVGSYHPFDARGRPDVELPPELGFAGGLPRRRIQRGTPALRAMEPRWFACEAPFASCAMELACETRVEPIGAP